MTGVIIISKVGIWGGDSEILPLNAVIGNGYTVNIHDRRSGIIHGAEHNREDIKIILIQYKDGHYTSLEKHNNS